MASAAEDHSRSWSFNRINALQLVGALRSASPAWLFGLRLCTAVCLALYIAFWLELDNAYWAGTSAATVCQPSLGASLRKAWFRMIGTVIGAVAIVVLTAIFPQDRIGFLVGLALWGAVCGFVATLLRNFASYAAALAGFTAAVIASDELGAIGGANGDVFVLAVTRTTEISIGIICAGVVLAATDFGGARHRLAARLSAISTEIAGNLAATFLLGGAKQSVPRDLIGRVAGLDAVIDEVIGESSDLRPHSPALQSAVAGLFAALTSWWTVAVHLELLRNGQARRRAGTIFEAIPPQLRLLPKQSNEVDWRGDPCNWKDCTSAVRSLARLPADTPSLRMLADRTADAFIGIRRALDGSLLLSNKPLRNAQSYHYVGFGVSDWLPAFVNAARIFVTIGAVALFWIATAWPNGAQAIVFAAIAVIVFSPRDDRAYSASLGYMIGISLMAICAAIIKFSVLPQLVTFAGFCFAISLVLLPAGSLTVRHRSPMLSAVPLFFPLLAPANQMSYDTLQFYNGALAIVAGVAAAALAFRLLPPLSPARRIRRLLLLTLRDLRRLARGTSPTTTYKWEGRIYGRLSELSEQAEPLQAAQMLAALSVGTETIRLRRALRRHDQELQLDAALDAIARGKSKLAIERLAQLDGLMTVVPCAKPGTQVRLRARGRILAISEALAKHAAYFDSRAAL
jgi:uncharacterized membrane protein YccC